MSRVGKWTDDLKDSRTQERYVTNSHEPQAIRGTGSNQDTCKPCGVTSQGDCAARRIAFNKGANSCSKNKIHEERNPLVFLVFTIQSHFLCSGKISREPLNLGLILKEITLYQPGY